MFRPLVQRRTFSLFNRIPYKRIVESAARDGHDTVTIHRVRIQRPFLSKSRLVGAVAVSAAIYGLGQYLSIEVEVQEEENTTRPAAGQDDGWQQVGPGVDDEDEEEYDDALLFLPTGFSRPRPKTYYRGSDPEWQAFKKLSQDVPRIKKIRTELATLVRNRIANTPNVVATIGNVDTKKGNLWIEFNFPDGPPLEYERPGIELTEDLEWRKATRPVEAAHHHRLNKMLAPTAVANAVYKDTTRRAANSWKTMKVYMGWDQESQTETVQQLVQRINTNPRSSVTSAVPSSTNPFSPTSAKDTQSPTASPAPADGPAKDIGIILPDPKSMTLDLTQFRQDFRKASQPSPLNATRGSVILKGLVEVHGDRVRMTLTVNAAYDVTLGQYTDVKIQAWSLTAQRQAPRGGP